MHVHGPRAIEAWQPGCRMMSQRHVGSAAALALGFAGGWLSASSSPGAACTSDVQLNDLNTGPSQPSPASACAPMTLYVACVSGSASAGGGEPLMQLRGMAIAQLLGGSALIGLVIGLALAQLLRCCSSRSSAAHIGASSGGRREFGSDGGRKSFDESGAKYGGESEARGVNREVGGPASGDGVGHLLDGQVRLTVGPPSHSPASRQAAADTPPLAPNNANGAATPRPPPFEAAATPPSATLAPTEQPTADGRGVLLEGPTREGTWLKLTYLPSIRLVRYDSGPSAAGGVKRKQLQLSDVPQEAWERLRRSTTLAGWEAAVEKMLSDHAAGATELL